MAESSQPHRDRDVLAVGLPPDLVQQVASGLAPARVEAISVDGAFDQLDDDRYRLLIIDAGSGVKGLLLVQHVRSSPRLHDLSVMYLMDRRTEGADSINDFIFGLGIEPVSYSEDIATVLQAARPILGFASPVPELPPRSEPDQNGSGDSSAVDALETRPHLLIVDAESKTTASVVAEASSRRIKTTVTGSMAEALRVLEECRPDVVLLDLALPYAHDDGRLADAGIALLEELRRRAPSIPVLVLTAHDTFGDRAAVVTRGGRGFLQKPMPAAEVVDTIVHLLQPERVHAGKVMIVNDDPIILKGLAAVLEGQGILTASLGSEADDLFRIWDVFERFGPDVLILDLDTPGVHGIDLCRVVRMDPRWASMPVIFLTGSRGAETVRTVFAAGADDFVDKSAMSPELVEKISHWLARAQWYHTMADVDPLTRLPNRRGGRQVLDRFLGTLRRRREGAMAVALLDIDNFKRINDALGHADADEVLRQVAERLRGTFQRPTDVVIRWGGEEFLIGMQDTTRPDATRLLERLLKELGSESILGSHRELVTFSAGVAEYPSEGNDLYELTRVADRRMYQAKRTGKNRVMMDG